MQFDPNDTAQADAGLFGLPFDSTNSRIHLIPVPWEVTTSYGDGASRGPEAVLRASHQVDLFDIETGDAYLSGYWMMPASEEIAGMGRDYKMKAKAIVKAIEEGREAEPQIQRLQKEINSASAHVNEWVYQQARRALEAGKVPAVLGGDHSTPYGLIRAVAESFGAESIGAENPKSTSSERDLSSDFGILHVDAHADLRDKYQGYEHSHASIMFNVMENVRPKKLVQVGIRDFSPGEYEYIQRNSDRIRTYFDPITKRRLNRGESWQSICDEIVGHLPRNVHISFDIDGLSPDLCPGTGTPVPGGLSFDQALTLFATVAESGRRIVSFDLTEVAESENSESDWDGNVGARLLFKLCGWTAVTNGWVKPLSVEAI